MLEPFGFTPLTVHIQLSAPRYSIAPGIRGALLAVLLLGGSVPVEGEDSGPGMTGVEAVASKVSDDYVRQRLPKGGFREEYYAFGKGGDWGGEFKDDSIDKLTFMDVARAIAPSLRAQNYLPAADPKATRLLILVYWGTTTVPPPYEFDPLYGQYRNSLEQYRTLLRQGLVDEANAVLTAGLHELEMANHIRDLADFKNSGMLGYDASGLIGTEHGKYLQHTGMRTEVLDEMQEIEQNRYFVVLMAYDFQLLAREKKHKLLWEARFSLNELHNQFDKALPAMASYASQYFGQPTPGLVRKRLRNTDVQIGEAKTIDVIDPAKK